LLWQLAVKKKTLLLLLQLLSKHLHLLLLQPLLLLTRLLLLQPLLLLMHLPLLQPLLLLMRLLLQLSNLRFNLKLLVKKPTFGLAFFLRAHFSLPFADAAGITNLSSRSPAPGTRS
jgi:hypothetical protein